MNETPVLYLDLDDTILTWADGEPAPASGVREFLLWALDRFQVRWLTRWARDGCMAPDLIVDLGKLTGVAPDRLREIRGLDWSDGSKLDGIAWMEHIIQGRPFVWLEDEETGTDHRTFFDRHGFTDCYLHCDVTKDAEALRRSHDRLKRLHD